MPNKIKTPEEVIDLRVLSSEELRDIHPGIDNDPEWKEIELLVGNDTEHLKRHAELRKALLGVNQANPNDPEAIKIAEDSYRKARVAVDLGAAAIDPSLQNGDSRG